MVITKVAHWKVLNCRNDEELCNYSGKLKFDFTKNTYVLTADSVKVKKSATGRRMYLTQAIIPDKFETNKVASN